MVRPEASSGGVLRPERFKVRDFLSRRNVALDSPDDSLSMEDTLLEGEFVNRELRPGLTLHVSDAREERAFTATSQIGAGLSCIFFLEGDVDLRIGDRHFEFRGRSRKSMEGTVIMNARPETFQRRSNGAQPLRHLVVSATPEWLNLEALPEASDEGRLSRLLKDHLASHRWVLTPRLVELVHQVVLSSTIPSSLRNLYLESRAVEIICETLATVTRTERRPPSGDLLSRQDGSRLERARDFIAANLTAPLSVEIIAREAGLNPSGLQRLFRLSEGVSIFEYVRKLRLERAYDALRSGRATVAEASLIAGYSNPANFATAFRRQFGTAPSAIAR